MAALLERVRPYLADIDAWAKAHSEAMTAAPEWLKTLLALVVDADARLPMLIGALREFDPAPGWGPGGTGYVPGPGNERGGI